MADDFVDQVIIAACRLAKLRESSTLELRDIQLILERNYNIRVPGYASDELRTVKKTQPTPGWAQKLSAVQAASKCSPRFVSLFLFVGSPRHTEKSEPISRFSILSAQSEIHAKSENADSEIL